MGVRAQKQYGGARFEKPRGPRSVGSRDFAAPPTTFHLEGGRAHYRKWSKRSVTGSRDIEKATLRRLSVGTSNGFPSNRYSRVSNLYAIAGSKRETPARVLKLSIPSRSYVKKYRLMSFISSGLDRTLAYRIRGINHFRRSKTRRRSTRCGFETVSYTHLRAHET